MSSDLTEVLMLVRRPLGAGSMWWNLQGLTLLLFHHACVLYGTLVTFHICQQSVHTGRGRIFLLWLFLRFLTICFSSYWLSVLAGAVVYRKFSSRINAFLSQLKPILIGQYPVNENIPTSSGLIETLHVYGHRRFHVFFIYSGLW